MFRGFIFFIVWSLPALAANNGSVLLSGQVDPQLSVTTSVDWAHWRLRLDNSSNIESQVFWIALDSTRKVRLDRTAMIDLENWVEREQALPGRQYRVTIASP